MSNPVPANTESISAQRLVCSNCHTAEYLSAIEHIEGKARLSGVRRLADGSIRLDYEGYTDVLWETQIWDTDEFWCDQCDSEQTLATLEVAGGASS